MSVPDQPSLPQVPPWPRPYRIGRARRAVDLAVATTTALLVAPLLAVAVLLIRMSGPGPVLHRATRVGEGGRDFSLYKLRTMRPGPGPAVTGADDPRITRLGALLRRTSIDELPQLWNVIRGDMTLVGPRPEGRELADRYPAECRSILEVRPGLTGPAQLRFRERSATPPPGWDIERWYLEVMVPRRVALDLEYLANPTLGRTLGYLVLTAMFVVGLASTEETTSGSQRAFRHSPVTRSNSKL